MRNLLFGLVFLIGCSTSEPRQDITRLWLTFSNESPLQLTVNWESPEPGNSEVILYIGDKKVFQKIIDENVTIHHVEVPINQTDVEYRYQVVTANYVSAWNTFKGLPSEGSLKIVVMADWGFAPDADITKILEENPSVIMTGGDNVPSLYEYGKEGNKHCLNSYLALVDSFPELFNHIPFIPAMGNHDHQLHPRGSEPPADYMVYDTLGTAFTEFFNLTKDGWKGSFTVPQYNIKFLRLDLNHIHDYGTNWQTCHANHKGSVQYDWYVKQFAEPFDGYTVTIMNANNPDMRRVEEGIWDPYLKKSSVVITGSGYYAEKAVVDDVPFLNTSLIAGDVWPDAIDPKAEFSESIASYVLLTVTDSVLNADIKTLDGKLYNRTTIKK